eukprot:708995-Pelagomonas_calceolata.AAC.1
MATRSLGTSLRRAFFQAKYEELLGTDGLLSNQAPSAFPPQAFTYDNFLWAVATVRARAHPPLEGGAIALVPLADAVRADMRA